MTVYKYYGMTESEKRYWELREEMDRVTDKGDDKAYNEALDEFTCLCFNILEEIMEEHSDVLKRLKNS